MGEWISGTFHEPSNANAAVEELISLSYPRESIRVVVSTDTRKRYFVDEDDDLTQGGKLGRGVAAGGAIGGTLGALAAATATLSTGGAAAPLVAGPLAVTLLPGAAGVGAGSVIGTLASAGIPSEEAAQIDRGATERRDRSRNRCPSRGRGPSSRNLERRRRSTFVRYRIDASPRKLTSPTHFEQFEIVPSVAPRARGRSSSTISRI